MGTGFDRYGYGYSKKYPRVTHAHNYVPMLFGDNHAGRKCVFIQKLRYTTTILMIIIPITTRSTVSTFSTRTINVSRTKGAALVCRRNDLVWQMQPETRTCYVRCCKTKTKTCAPFMEPFDARLL
jgi:hypothetical protein